MPWATPRAAPRRRGCAKVLIPLALALGALWGLPHDFLSASSAGRTRGATGQESGRRMLGGSAPSAAAAEQRVRLRRRAQAGQDDFEDDDEEGDDLGALAASAPPRPVTPEEEFEGVTGTVRLYATHTLCISCLACCCQFKRLLPNVKLEVAFDVWRETRRWVGTEDPDARRKPK